MKLSEKSLELNIGAEILWLFRGPWNIPKAYLRGLTQREEAREGVDSFLQLDPATRIFAFQLKAPKEKFDVIPYRFTLMREQHDRLFDLAQAEPDSVFYVFPFYATAIKLQQDIPELLQDTWLAAINRMPSDELFGAHQSRTINCEPGRAFVNPEYRLINIAKHKYEESHGISIESFREWHVRFRNRAKIDRKRRSPWLVRGLRLVIVLP